MKRVTVAIILGGWFLIAGVPAAVAGNFSPVRESPVSPFADLLADVYAGPWKNTAPDWTDVPQTGVLQGSARWISGQGFVLYEGHFNGGRPHGINRSFYQDGTLKFEGQFNNGQLNGIARWYHRDGSIQFEAAFINGLPQRVVEYPSESPTT